MSSVNTASLSESEHTAGSTRLDQLMEMDSETDSDETRSPVYITQVQRLFSAIKNDPVLMSFGAG